MKDMNKRTNQLPKAAIQPRKTLFASPGCWAAQPVAPHEGHAKELIQRQSVRRVKTWLDVGPTVVQQCKT